MCFFLVFCGGSTATTQDLSIVKGLLSHLGMCVEVKENMMSGAGVIAGCGPAFVSSTVPFFP